MIYVLQNFKEKYKGNIFLRTYKGDQKQYYRWHAVYMSKYTCRATRVIFAGVYLN